MCCFSVGSVSASRPSFLVLAPPRPTCHRHRQPRLGPVSSRSRIHTNVFLLSSRTRSAKTICCPQGGLARAIRPWRTHQAAEIGVGLRQEQPVEIKLSEQRWVPTITIPTVCLATKASDCLQFLQLSRFCTICRGRSDMCYQLTISRGYCWRSPTDRLAWRTAWLSFTGLFKILAC